MFEFELKTNELYALDALVESAVKSETNLLPSWTYMGQDVWTMDFDIDAPETAAELIIETADVA